MINQSSAKYFLPLDLFCAGAEIYHPCCLGLKYTFRAVERPFVSLLNIAIDLHDSIQKCSYIVNTYASIMEHGVTPNSIRVGKCRKAINPIQ